MAGLAVHAIAVSNHVVFSFHWTPFSSSTGTDNDEGRNGPILSGTQTQHHASPPFSPLTSHNPPQSWSTDPSLPSHIVYAPTNQPPRTLKLPVLV